MFKSKFTLLAISFFFCAAVNAQLEGAYLKTMHISKFGMAGFLNFAIPINDADAATAEVGVYYFGFNNYSDQAVVVPIIAGYRHTFNGEGDGLYIEPFAGYSIGATDIPRTDKDGNIVYTNGNEQDERINGIAAGAVFGYIFPGSFRFNIGLKAQHIFTFSGDPAANIISLRLSHSLHFGRRRDD